METSDEWAERNAGYFDPPEAEVVGMVLASWRVSANLALGRDDVELAAAFQRHYTKLGTGLPPNFALAVTADEVIACKFDPSSVSHPRAAHDSQFKKEVARWPRESIRFGETETGPLAYGMTLHVDGRKPIPCRAPKLPKNPASAYAVVMLGGELPA